MKIFWPQNSTGKKSGGTTILVSFGIWRIRSEDILYVDVFENDSDEDSVCHWSRVCGANSIKMSDKDAFLDEFNCGGNIFDGASHRIAQKELSNRMLAAFLANEDSSISL